MSTLVEIKAQFERTVPIENNYRVEVDIIDIVNIVFDVLVFDAEHDTFSRVASVYDLEAFPNSKQAAATAGLDYYRGRNAVVTFLTIKDATGFEAVTKQRLKILAVAWSSIVDNFSGTDTVLVSSSLTP